MVFDIAAQPRNAVQTTPPVETDSVDSVDSVFTVAVQAR